MKEMPAMLRRTLWVALAALIAIGTLACGPDVGALEKKPAKYDGDNVLIEGRVGSIRLSGGRRGQEAVYLYQVHDGDHAVWVLRGPEAETQAKPRKNYDISVKGVVKVDMKLEGETLPVVVVEKSGKQKIPPLTPGSARH